MTQRLKLMVGAGTAVILMVIAAGTAHLVQRTEQVARRTAEQDLERSAVAVENNFNRQLLQVDGVLASLVTLFDLAQLSPHQPAAAGRLLRGLNFQTMPFRNLLLVGPDGSVVASARPKGESRAAPNDFAGAGPAPTELIGPFRNAVTGDWSLYLVRKVPRWSGISAVAEVPLRTMMQLLEEASSSPGAQIFLERASGQLVAALPHDELLMGKRREPAVGGRAADGKAFWLATDGDDAGTLSVARTALYEEIRVVLSASGKELLANWRRDRDRTIMAATVAALLIAAFAAALLLAIRQRERADAERGRASSFLGNAIDAMSDGFVMWDEDDRLVTCNQRYRDLYAVSAPFMTVGARFDDIIRQGAELGQYPQAADDLDEFVSDVISWHRQGSGSIERLLPDGRWLLITERRTADGGTVGIRTDITALKGALAGLAAANERLAEAAEEAQRQNAALIEQESRIRFLAHHDDLTGLQNRFAFRDRIARSLQHAPGEDAAIALLFLDLDRFKDVNDTLGHPVGDLLLRSVARRLASCVPDIECVARLGGDEFAVLCHGWPAPMRWSELNVSALSA